MRGSASAWSRFPNSKDLKSLGSDYSESSEPYTFLVHKTYTPVVNICIQSLCSHHGLGLDTIEKATRHICSKSSTFMSRNGGKKRRKKMLLSRFSNWRLIKSLLLDNRKNSLNLIKYQIFHNVTIRKYQVFLGSHRIGRWGQGAQCSAFPVSKSTPTKV